MSARTGPLGSARGGPLPRETASTAQNVAAAKQLAPFQFTATSRQKPQRHAWGEPHVVLSSRGRLSLLLLVARCAFGCGRAHVHRARLGFVTGRRKAGCGAGTYVVHALSWQEPAA